jgi:hypothetical protein
MQYIAESVSTKESNREAVRMAIRYFDKEGDAPTQEIIDTYKETMKKDWARGGNKRFIEIMKDEFKGIPVDVEVNVAGKQKNLGKVADGLTNIYRQVLSNPQALQNKGMADLFNQIVESAGFSPVDFQGLEEIQQPQQPQQPVLAGASQGQIINQ